ncbi:MAG: hypothetical protein E6J78_15420 [Deltaproteobacteria bacterium]|nr:MAG: hypothetical protein E6J78_15420 [Deltaproteobacteria bacterium]
MIGLYAIVADAPRQAAGSRGEPLQTIQLEGFSALAGEAPPPLSVESLRAHEAAVRRIAEAVEACLPARFGAAASDTDTLRRALADRAEELRQALALVRGREQMTLRIHGPGAATAALSAKEGGAGTRYLEERRRARQLPEIDPLRRALAGLVRAERIERHSEPGLLASVYHLIDRGAAPAYARAIGEIPLEELRVAVSGPWPAWSFAPEVALP